MFTQLTLSQTQGQCCATVWEWSLGHWNLMGPLSPMKSIHCHSGACNYPLNLRILHCHQVWHHCAMLISLSPEWGILEPTGRGCQIPIWCCIILKECRARVCKDSLLRPCFTYVYNIPKDLNLMHGCLETRLQVDYWSDGANLSS
jgi:hypothetical protein